MTLLRSARAPEYWQLLNEHFFGHGPEILTLVFLMILLLLLMTTVMEITPSISAIMINLSQPYCYLARCRVYFEYSWWCMHSLPSRPYAIGTTYCDATHEILYSQCMSCVQLSNDMQVFQVTCHEMTTSGCHEGIRLLACSIHAAD